MKVSLASALGTCFGVQDAINMAMAPEFHNDLTIIGQLVHNPQINESLKNNGISVVKGIEDIGQIKTKKVMITAHGAAEKTQKKLHEAGFTVYDASCPLVMRVHKTIKAMVEKKFFPVVIGQEDHVEVRGIVGDLDDYLGCFDVLVHPALKEGLGVIALKAAAAAVPVVGFRAGGLSEVVVHQETGLLVEPGNVQKLADAIGLLIDDSDLRHVYGRMAAERMRDNFSVTRMVDQHMTMYESIFSA